LYTLAPEVINALFSDDGLGLFDSYISSAIEDAKSAQDLLRVTTVRPQDGPCALHVRSWLDRWVFQHRDQDDRTVNDFLDDAYFSLVECVLRKLAGEPCREGRRLYSRPFLDFHRTFDISLGQLALVDRGASEPALLPPDVWEVLASGDLLSEAGFALTPKIGEFTPEQETDDDAVKRIIPELERRLRQVLKEIASGHDNFLGAQGPMPEDRGGRKWEYLVRYQVLGAAESLTYEDVAADCGVAVRTIAGEIPKAANAIGITLRAKPGRPKVTRDPS